MLKNKRAFTLIELIVVMAVIGILVLLAIPKFIGHTKEAKLTKFIHDTKQLETASERYYMDTNEWPKLFETPYTSDQINDFAQKVYDATGKEVILDTNGQYYDIDYNKLQKYIKLHDNHEYYIIQNPVGNVYSLQGLSDRGKNRLTSNEPTNQTPTAVITMTPNTDITTSTNIVWSYNNSTDPDGDSLTPQWELDGLIKANPNGVIATTGNHTMRLRVQDSRGLWSNWVSITFNVGTSKVGQTIATPEAGWLRLDDRDNKITYSLWSGQQTDGGCYASTKTYAGQISFKFYGTKFRIISQSYLDTYHKGSINVTVDGVLVGNYNEYAPNQFKKMVFELTNLNLGIHTIVLSIAENTDGNMNMFLDALDIDDTGYLITPIGKTLTAPEPTWKRIDDKDSAIVYQLWSGTDSSPSAYLTTYHYAGQITFKFHGTKFRIMGVSWNDVYHDGIINVTVDGVLKGAYNEYAPEVRQRLNYEQLDLPLGDHTVVLSIGQNKSGQMSMFLDAIDIDSTGHMIP